MYFNADSLLNKRTELEALASIHEPDIIAVTEVLPKNCRDPVQKSEFNLDGYEFHCNTTSTGNRGVGIFTKNSLNCLEVHFNDSAHETIWLETKLVNQDRLLIGCIYRSPNSNNINNEDILNSLKQATGSKYSHVLIVGDFNHPELNWTDCTSPPDPNHPASQFMDCTRDCFLHQHITEPTHFRGNQQANILDLVMTNEENMIDDINFLPPLGKSHHSCLSFLFKCYHPASTAGQTKLIYDKGDYDEMNKILREIDWDAELQDKSTNEQWNFIKGKIDSAVTKCIPVRRPNSTGYKKKPLWMNETALTKLKKKRAAYQRYLSTREGKEYEEYARLRNQTKWEIRKAKRDFEKEIASKAKSNPKAFYNYSKSKLKTRSGVGDIKREDGSVTENDREKAEELNTYFSSVFTKEDTTNIPDFDPEIQNQLLDNLVITEEQVRKRLEKLKTSKSPGIDGMHPRLLKEIAETITKPLCILFNASISERVIPPDWKDGQVTPIHKKGSKANRANYRPVSLTSIICKILEHFIRDGILTHMRAHLVDCQHGFLSGRSCVTQLLETLDVWTKLLDSGSPLDVIYLDFAKAFDTVPHQRLLKKLEGYGITGNILGWITDFLTNRRQRVAVNGSFSSWTPVLSGIPQGSVLGPVLFICYINDMPGEVNSMIEMFADDTKIFTNIESEEDSEALQADLVKLQEWANKWQMRFNASKCKVMHLGRTNTHAPYNMQENGENVKLTETVLEKDLGVQVDNNLKFSDQAELAANKGSQIVGMIRRAFVYLDGKMITTLFKSLVRPHLEYANSVWSPLYKKDVLVLENVQRRTTKLVPELKDLPYEERLRRLKLPSLVYRRLRGDLIETYKYLHGFYNVDSSNLLPLEHDTNTRGHNLKLQKQRFNTDTRKRFFSNRVVDYWNLLPDAVANAPSMNTFKNRLDLVYSESQYVTDFPIPTTRPDRKALQAIAKSAKSDPGKDLLQA